MAVGDSVCAYSCFHVSLYPRNNNKLTHSFQKNTLFCPKHIAYHKAKYPIRVQTRLLSAVQEKTALEDNTTLTGQPYGGWDKQAWLRGWENQDKEINVEIDLNSEEAKQWLTGELPTDIKGTLFRNGPAKFRVGSDIVFHPWDGDGMIAAITLAENKLWFRNRFVRTEGYGKESAANRILFRGTFGTPIPGGWLRNVFNVKMKNVANTNVLLWNKRLFALWEGGMPYELDPKNLITLGEKKLDPSMGSNFTAHPKVETETGRLIGFSSQLGLQSSKLTFYEWDENFHLLHQKVVTIPGFGFYHDFAITPNYYILFQAPMDFTPWKFVLGLCSAAECMSFYKDRPGKLFLIPRHSNVPVKEVQVKSGFVFHFANAFEQDQIVTIDAIRVAELFLGGISEARKNNQSVVYQVDYENQVPRSCLYRYQVDVSVDKCVNEHILLDRQVEFPMVHPNYVGKQHSIVYLGINGCQQVSPVQGIAKVNLTRGTADTWIPKPHEFAVEPIFIPKSMPRDGTRLEDDGYLITLVYDGKRNKSYYAILDAQRIQDGPLCTIQLPIAIPHGLHGMWSNCVFSKQDAKKQSSTYEIFYSKKWNVVQSDFPML